MNAVEPLVLAVESSCDETSAAILDGSRNVLGHVILSQDAHAVYGGVVPEIAARAHLDALDDVVDATLRQAQLPLDRMTAFAATAGPGLIGALLVGLTWTKATAWALRRPFVPVHHMEAHLFATALVDPHAVPPFVALLVSGGHTLLVHVAAWGDYRLLGETRDDAAGEAFDKVAKILGLGFPGGPRIEEAAREGDPAAHALPRPMLGPSQQPPEPDSFDFSFSGLKTAVLTRVRDLERGGPLAPHIPDLAASFQAAVVDVLVAKTVRAVERTGCRRVVLGGGVAASRALRTALTDALSPASTLHVPSPRLATDNAAMIASAALFRMERGDFGSLAATAQADLPFPGLARSGTKGASP
ncbi:MAG: tRNA (adenosine(37)-N6)-threonylcarbamoyltransferase complex transferase subunit TsaD [Gemmatimonadetes bacterium]|nr:tRNA (adenosine(37)-N6)-threonylcarbamoyltransferase complex transferase subunit TsaD [Gemmatimonadota bacterium]